MVKAVKKLLSGRNPGWLQRMENARNDDFAPSQSKIEKLKEPLKGEVVEKSSKSEKAQKRSTAANAKKSRMKYMQVRGDNLRAQ